MLSLNELRNSKINADVAREAYSQSEKRLSDVLETKKSFEQKAFTLFGAYTTISFALIGVAGSLFKDSGASPLVLAMGASGLVLVAGAILLVLALHERTYGTLGSNPEIWLRKDTIDGVEAALPLMLAYVTFHHQERIEASIASNKAMGFLIRWAVYVGVLTPVVALALLLSPPCFVDWLKTLL